MSSQQYKDKLQQFYLENTEIKNATMEGENTSIRIAQHYRTLLDLLRLLGIQEILEAGDTSTTGTVAKLLGGVSIADVFKVSSDIGLTDPNDPPQQVLTRLANGDIKLKPIEDFVSGNYIEKLEPSDPEGQYVLLADGTRINPQTLVAEKEIVKYNSSNPRPTIGEEAKLYIDTETDKAYLWDETTQDYVGIDVIDLSNYYNQQQVNDLLDDKVGKTGNEDIQGKKTFDTVPESKEDAAAENDLIRKSQWDTYNQAATTQITQGLAGKEDKANKKTIIDETNKESNLFYPSIKAVYDWAVGKFLDLRLSNLEANLTTEEKDGIKTKLGIGAEPSVITISSDTTLTNEHHNAIIVITGDCEITVPNGLKVGFNCSFDTIGSNIAEFIEGVDTTFSAPYGKFLRNNSTCVLYRMPSGTYRLTGALAPV